MPLNNPLSLSPYPWWKKRPAADALEALNGGEQVAALQLLWRYRKKVDTLRFEAKKSFYPSQDGQEEGTYSYTFAQMLVTLKWVGAMEEWVKLHSKEELHACTNLLKMATQVGHESMIGLLINAGVALADQSGCLVGYLPDARPSAQQACAITRLYQGAGAQGWSVFQKGNDQPTLLAFHLVQHLHPKASIQRLSQPCLAHDTFLLNRFWSQLPELLWHWKNQSDHSRHTEESIALYCQTLAILIQRVKELDIDPPSADVLKRTVVFHEKSLKNHFATTNFLATMLHSCTHTWPGDEGIKQEALSYLREYRQQLIGEQKARAEKMLLETTTLGCTLIPTRARRF